MKIVVGIESAERAKSVGSLVKSLGIENASIELLHVLERIAEDKMPPPPEASADLITRFLKMQEEEAQGVLASGHAALTQLGLASTTKLMTGFAGNRILARSEEGGADLLALGSSGRGLLNGSKLGSVGRKALTSAKCSVLIAKNAPSQGRPLTAVIATDHSQYANRCLEKLMSWNPKGIGRAVVTTVYPEQLLKSMTSLMNHFKADVSSWVKGELERNNAEFIRKFANVVPNCTGRVESGDVGDTLERVMKEEGADLLILGSQGHGFLERMFVGSISLDQAMSRSYSTLVVRA